MWHADLNLEAVILPARCSNQTLDLDWSFVSDSIALHWFSVTLTVVFSAKTSNSARERFWFSGLNKEVRGGARWHISLGLYPSLYPGTKDNIAGFVPAMDN